MSDEWGPWIEHDGKGCPCVGQYVQSEERCGLIECHIAWGIRPERHADAWDWGTCPMYPKHHIIRYRIRKPKGLTILEGILADLPNVKSPEKVGGAQ